MNWNLVWIPEPSESNDCSKPSGESKFIFYLGDEPILTKRMYGQIYRTDKDSWLTFVENSHKFSFEDFNEFIVDFEKSAQAKIKFDVWDGEEAFAYDSESDRLTIALDSYTSNMYFSIPIDERTRVQFAGEFKKFLTYYLEFFEASNTLCSTPV